MRLEWQRFFRRPRGRKLRGSPAEDEEMARTKARLLTRIAWCLRHEEVLSEPEASPEPTRPSPHPF